MKKRLIIILLLIFAILIAGCSTSKPAQNAQTETTAAEKTEEISAAPEVKEEIIGPGKCKTASECTAYCLKNVFDCKAWCEASNENKATCEKQGIKIEMPSGVPGSPCADDRDCYQGLVCIGYKCSTPTPDNMMRKSAFSLPGGCSSVSGCADYCIKPQNTLQCTEFCNNFPSLCQNLNEIRAEAATEECRACTQCRSKDCILDCTYRCYAYTPVDMPDVEGLKQGFEFERKYVEPITAVWEPGPAYNKIGITYFSDDYKELGVNTYHIIPKYTHKDNELVRTADYLSGEKADAETTANLIKAKKAGFQTILVAHDLYDLFPNFNPDKNEKINAEDYVDDIEDTAMKWAKIAEEYKAEYFVPVNEFEYMLYENGYSAEKACEITNSLYRSIIPKVRNIYKGKIYCRAGGMDGKFGCMDFSQCDIFGFTYGFSGGSYSDNFRKGFEAAEQASARDNVPYIMAEAFSLNPGECENLHKAGIKAYMDTSKKGIGYTFMGLVQRDPIGKKDCPLINTPLANEYKNFFSWMKSRQAS